MLPDSQMIPLLILGEGQTNGLFTFGKKGARSLSKTVFALIRIPHLRDRHQILR